MKSYNIYKADANKVYISNHTIMLENTKILICRTILTVHINLLKIVRQPRAVTFTAVASGYQKMALTFKTILL